MKNKDNSTQPIRVSKQAHTNYLVRAAILASERGLDKLSLPAYIAEASKFFEDHRPKHKIKEATAEQLRESILEEARSGQ